MPAYCGSCPYSKYCKNAFIQNPTCSMGYVPVRLNSNVEKPSGSGIADRAGHILELKILLKIGKTAVNKNDFETGIECFRKVLEIAPDDSEASFLLKRAEFMIKDETNPERDQLEQKEKPEPIQKTTGMLPQQKVLESIQIKPKQQFEIDPNIINPKTGKVYQVQMNATEEEIKAKEDVSRTVAIRDKGSIMGKRGTTIVLGLTIAIILMIVIGLWQFGFLDI